MRGLGGRGRGEEGRSERRVRLEPARADDALAAEDLLRGDVLQPLDLEALGDLEDGLEVVPRHVDGAAVDELEYLVQVVALDALEEDDGVGLEAGHDLVEVVGPRRQEDLVRLEVLAIVRAQCDVLKHSAEL